MIAASKDPIPRNGCGLPLGDLCFVTFGASDGMGCGWMWMLRSFLGKPHKTTTSNAFSMEREREIRHLSFKDFHGFVHPAMFMDSLPKSI